MSTPAEHLPRNALGTLRLGSEIGDITGVRNSTFLRHRQLARSSPLQPVTVAIDQYQPRSLFGEDRCCPGANPEAAPVMMATLF